MRIFDLFGKKDVSAELTKKIPYSIKASFHPIRLNANKRNSVTMKVELTNLTKEPLLTSLVVKVPKKLGLDETCISHTREIRIGELPPKERRVLNVEVYGSTKTDEGTYPIHIIAIAHYRNYTYVLNSEKKKVSLRAV